MSYADRLDKGLLLLGLLKVTQTKSLTKKNWGKIS